MKVVDGIPEYSGSFVSVAIMWNANWGRLLIIITPTCRMCGDSSSRRKVFSAYGKALLCSPWPPYSTDLHLS